MAGFFYFIPEPDPQVPCVIEAAGQPRVLNLNLIDEHGLTHVFGDRMGVSDETVVHRFDEGPDNSPGWLLYPRPFSKAIPDDFRPAAGKIWRNFADAFWIGCLESDPPGPNDMIRSMWTRGMMQDDCLGRTWLIPIIHSKAGRDDTLERQAVVDRFGKIARNIKPDHAWLWDLGGKIYDHLRRTEIMSSEDEFMACVHVLQYNYRIGLPELYMMGELGQHIIDAEFTAKILGSATNFEVLETVSQAMNEEEETGQPSKKNSGDELKNVSPGAEENIQPTNIPGGTLQSQV